MDRLTRQVIYTKRNLSKKFGRRSLQTARIRIFASWVLVEPRLARFTLRHGSCGCADVQARQTPLKTYKEKEDIQKTRFLAHQVILSCFSLSTVNDQSRNYTYTHHSLMYEVRKFLSLLLSRTHVQSLFRHVGCARQRNKVGSFIPHFHSAPVVFHNFWQRFKELDD